MWMNTPDTSTLRSGDGQGISDFAVIVPVGKGLDVAIRDRLLGASHGNWGLKLRYYPLAT